MRPVYPRSLRNEQKRTWDPRVTSLLRAVSSLLRHVSVMASEILARARFWDGAGHPGGDGGLMEEASRARVSMVLTSAPHWHHTSRRNRSIPTILADYFHYRAVDVSTVDTELPAGSTPRGRRSGAGCPHPEAGPTFPACPFRLPHGVPEVVVRHRLRPTTILSRPTPRRSGSAEQGL